MKSSWFPILMICALLGLLVLLATLQYQWLGQISNAEQIRLGERLKDDTKRFADDFNAEIQQAYFMFQLTADDWGKFNERFKLWKEKTIYKDVINDFHYVKNDEPSKLLLFDKRSETFRNTVWTDEFKNISRNFVDVENVQKFDGDEFALIVPIHKTRSELKKIVGERKKAISFSSKDGKILTENIIGPKITSEDADKLLRRVEITSVEGFLIIRLDKDVIKDQILPTLTKKYFSESDGGSYRISVSNEKNAAIFQTHAENIENADATTKLFAINPNGVFFFARESNLPLNNKVSKTKVIMGKASVHRIQETTDSGETVDVEVITGNKPDLNIEEQLFTESSGLWTLKVQHIDGSLDQFITNTRRRNLAISFGILSLLAVSIILIFLSSQRAKSLAQKQMDFVSSVSHEFRTPLAVIYSASENLSDGLIDEREKIYRYGTLIKREGKKLSGMVEQILEFAGANSGKRKYDFRNVDIQFVIDEALAECQPFIDEKDFVVEKDVSDKLPTILADEKALTLAIQNLINNSIKYSNGSNWLKISAKIENGSLRISVADRGIGITNKERKQIFEPFFRAENVVDEQISGNGLGLSLVKQIVDAHGGNIRVKSEVGTGSEFIIELPLKL